MQPHTICCAQAFVHTVRKMQTEPVGLQEVLDALCGQPPQAALQECRFSRKGPLKGAATLAVEACLAAGGDFSAAAVRMSGPVPQQCIMLWLL